MAQHRTVAGLPWVREELAEVIRKARDALEEYIEGGGQSLVLKPCAAYLEQVRGVLEMLELTGAMHLAEEMRQSVAALIERTPEDPREAAEALVLALIQLPDYLEKLGTGGEDMPLLLLPAINDLRVSRGEPPLTEADLVLADLGRDTVDADREAEAGATGLRQEVRGLRPVFHRHLLAWFKGQNAEQALADLFADLEEALAPGGLLRAGVRAARVLMIEVVSGDVPADKEVKTLVGRMDHVFKHLLQGNTPRQTAEDERGLIRDLLRRVAHSESSHPEAIALRADLDLDHLFPSPEVLAESRRKLLGPGSGVMASIRDAAATELLPIKDALDLYIRGGVQDIARLRELGDPIERLSKTLDMVALDGLSGRLRRRAGELRALADGEAPAESLLMSIAGDLLAVESTLDDLARDHGAEQGEGGAPSPAELARLRTQTLGEAKIDLTKAKEAITDFITDSRDTERIALVSGLFQRVAGVLRLLSQERAAGQLERVNAFIRDQLLARGRVPEDDVLEALADAISAIEYFMEALAEERADRDRILNMAEDALAQMERAQARESSEVSLPEQEAAPAGKVAVAEPEPVVETGGVDLLPLEVDSELLEIFLEEAREEEEAIAGNYPRWREDPEDQAALASIRRSFHTLKGSGRLVGAEAIGEYAWAVENLLNRIIDQTRVATPEILAYLDRAVAALPGLISALAGEPAPELNLDDMIETGHRLAEQPAEAAESLSEPSSEASAPESLPLPEEISAPGLEDSELREIFREEAGEHLDALRAFLARCREHRGACVVEDSLVRDFHTLSGSARMTGLDALADLAKAFELKALEWQEAGSAMGGEFLGLCERAVEVIGALVGGGLEGGGKAGADALLERVRGIQPGAEVSPEMEEVGEGSATGIEDEEEIEILPPPVEFSEPPVAPAGPAEAVSEPVSGPVEEVSPPEEAPVAPPEEVPVSAGEAEEVPGLSPGGPAGPAEAVSEPVSGPVEEVPPPEDAPLAPPEGIPVPTGEAEGIPGAPPVPEGGPGVPEEAIEQIDADPELLEIFLEEAEDLLERLDSDLRAWREAPASPDVPAQMQRTLHTLKGGARLAGIGAVGDLSHALETLLTAVTERGGDEAALALAQQAVDSLSEQIEAVRGGEPVDRALPLLERLQQAREGGPITAEAEVPAGPTATAGPQPAAGGLEPALRKVVTPEARPAPKAPVVATREQVRVRPELLDRLVNDAGEIAIYRARLEEHNTNLGFTLGELAQTVERLHGQLRQLEIETEAQILYRFEREGGQEGRGKFEEGFDPLELDRFSTMQQLSRSLMETVADLGSIGDMLGEFQRGTETLLVQQSRVANDLQDGLMRTRMVPFQRIVPRLARLVRQTAHSLGKQAELEIHGAEGEMDRNILERMGAPLEHLLRNAVSHGIESPAQRQAAGKPPMGRISLYVAREGNEVVIVVSDDGAGLDLAMIRARAEERGLIESGAQIDDDDLMQLILEPGFSTAGEVTQISGRGVGTDVVVNEVRHLGGTLEIESQPGRGTGFTIRLPFTLAISESLLAEAADEIFAIPHVGMEGVVRISANHLAACYEGRAEGFEYAGHRYQVRFLGELLGLGEPVLAEGRKWYPLLLVRTGEHRMAMQVDRLLGNQQIVVKSVGPQIASVRWISGGTILADGRVALILDPGALVRAALVHGQVHAEPPRPEAAAPAGPQRPTVLVVDDSITVRKVTSRLLTRHGMNVLTAKDGVDAVAVMQEQLPDLVLLDIEMPRMDGYELARHMRASPDLNAIPIIMITSRAGRKHRDLALSLGVRRYLGKPYQETELLENVHGVLAEVEA